MGGEMTLPL
ncbi:Protein of unknown function [Gryllus bimaculatus]|nr:Protein of unknown function [Gryllus bimaculatus]